MGIAYVAPWGWIEADLVVFWRLRTAELQIDLQAVANGRIGSAFRLTKFVKLGFGLFTDFSPVDRLSVGPVASMDFNFYGVHLGFLFSNREVHPDRQKAQPAEKEGVGLAIALGLRYAHGRGDALGLLIPDTYDPASLTTAPIRGTVNEISFNLGAKVLF